MSLTLDHVILVVPDLAAASKELGDALGVEVQFGGEHPGWGTHNAIVRLGSSYLELIAVNNVAEARQRPRGARLLEALDRGPGWLGYALRADDLDAEVSAIRARGLAIGDPQPGRRMRPDGIELRWRAASFDDAMWGGLLPFLIQHEGQVPADPPGISAVEVAVRDLEASIPTYSALFGREPARRADSASWRLADAAQVRLRSSNGQREGLACVALSAAGRNLTVLGAEFVLAS